MPSSEKPPSLICPPKISMRQAKLALIDKFVRARPTLPAASRLTATLSKLVDQQLMELWQQCQLHHKASLLAVGGYGRGELFPYSDVDILVLITDQGAIDPVDPQNTQLLRNLETFIALCWDHGIEIGASVRTIAQCIEQGKSDITTQTAMLESRLICGSEPLFSEFSKAQQASLDAKVFFRAKSLEMRQRHQKFQDTPYALEPNCKESPGGLRDLQVVMWVARAAGFGKTWSELASNGLLTAFEAKQLKRNAGILKLIRACLHVQAMRREDRLLFDLQTAVANSFGFNSTAHLRASEVLMHRYYWAAKAVTQLNQILMLNIEERLNYRPHTPMRHINEDFLDRSGLLEVVSDDLFQRKPQAILQTFYLYQTQPGLNGLSTRTLRALYNARSVMNKAFRSDPVNWATFRQILQAPKGQTHALRMMNATSVLGRTLWVFRRIVGQMQHDLFHVYTVDQHILMVLRNVRRFFIPEHAHEYPLCSDLAAQWDKPYILYIAALFHDIAKGRGGDHSDLGAREVKRFCRQHQLSKADTELIAFLVEHHLTLSHTAQKADLSDPEVIERFVKLVRNETRLNGLYLLTVADIRGTSPKVWNAWKAKLLTDLYRLSLSALGGAQPNRSADIEAKKRTAREMLEQSGYSNAFELPLWETLDVSYFARHDVFSIAWHARELASQLNTATPLVKAQLSPLGEGLQVLVYVKDFADLFVRICGYFDSAGFDIVDAKVHTTQAGYALDTFQVSSGLPEQLPTKASITFVEEQLAQMLQSHAPLPQVKNSRVSRRMRNFPINPRVTLQPDERGQRWVLTVTANDRRGLLYAIAQVMARHKINLQLAKITTLGERVEDTFLIDGALLHHNKEQLQIESELLDALNA